MFVIYSCIAAIFLILFGLLFEIYYRWQYRKVQLLNEQELKKGKKPKILPFYSPTLSMFKFFFLLGTGFTKPLRTLAAINKQIDEIRKLNPDCPGFQDSIFGIRSIVFWNIDDLKDIFLRADRSGSTEKLRNFTADIYRLLGESVLMLQGEKWVRQRQLLSPAFQFNHIRSLIPIFTDVALQLVSKWENLVNTPVEVYPWMGKATLEAIGRAGFGYEFRVLQEDGKINENVRNYQTVITSLNDPFRFLFKWWSRLPLEKNRRIEKAFQQFESFILSIISKKREKLLQKMEEKKNHDAADADHELDILDALIIGHGGLSTENDEEDATSDDVPKQQQQQQQHHKKLNDQELLHNVNTFFIAGQETSSSALSFALYMFAQHPDIQSQAREEVIRNLGSDIKRPATWDEIKRLTYLECCIKETLRLFPSLMFISRMVSQDGQLCGYQVPKGVLVSVPVMSIHRQPELWPEPERFLPDRFASGKHIHPYSWLPFSVGARQCIGINFAMLEIRIVLAVLLRTFVFEIDQNTKVPFGFDLTNLISGVVPPLGHTLIFRKLHQEG